MPTTPRQATLVQESFESIRDQMQLRADEFYQHMFQLDPQLKSMFKSDLNTQGMRFMSALGAIVDNLTNPDILIDRYTSLAEEHAMLGVSQEDFDTMGEALIGTLRDHLGKDFSSELEEAWFEAYNDLADAMIDIGRIE